MISAIYEDNHLLVLNKPAGMLTQPNDTEQDSLQEKAKAWLKNKYKKPGNIYLEPIHRLDRVTSGIVVFAKTSKALPRLMASIRERTTKKVYLALVHPAPQLATGNLEHYLIHDEHRAKIVRRDLKESKLATLDYRVLESTTKHTLLEIDLYTGRYHQIRVQLAEIGCPIVGDEKYGSLVRWDGKGIPLHHARFEIAHPVTKEILGFECQPEWLRTTPL